MTDHADLVKRLRERRLLTAEELNAACEVVEFGIRAKYRYAELRIDLASKLLREVARLEADLAALTQKAEKMREALERVCAQIVVKMEWIDNHDAAFRDSGEYMGDASLAREAIAEADAALKAWSEGMSYGSGRCGIT